MQLMHSIYEGTRQGDWIMDIRQLSYFIGVAEHRSFTKAAEALHITQPTLSKMIRSLEDELAAQLFDRTVTPIDLTDAGAALLPSAKQVVLGMDRIKSEMDDVVRLAHGTVRLGIPPMIGMRFFPAAIERFHVRYPGIQLEMIEQGGKRIEADIEHGALDIGFVIEPIEHNDRFHAHPCIDERLSLVLHPEHPLAARGSVELSELAAESFILFREEFTIRHLITSACLRAGYQPQVAFESSQWDFIAEMVGIRLGVTLFPESVCRLLSSERFRVVPIAPPAIPWRMSMIWRRDHYISHAARAWIRLIREQPLS
jgi:DNA-binding transcriptional LysR family regulator